MIKSTSYQVDKYTVNFMSLKYINPNINEIVCDFYEDTIRVAEDKKFNYKDTDKLPFVLFQHEIDKLIKNYLDNIA